MFKLTTKNIEYIRYTYTLTDSYAKGFGAVYELKETSRPDYFLPLTVRIERNLKKSKAKGIDEWLLFGKSNKEGEKTGLRPLKANQTGEYYGDKLYKGKKSFLLVQLSKDNSTLIIDSFRGFYPTPSKSYLYSSHQFKF
jgi:hypothetical protein